MAKRAFFVWPWRRSEVGWIGFLSGVYGIAISLAQAHSLPEVPRSDALSESAMQLSVGAAADLQFALKTLFSASGLLDLPPNSVRVFYGASGALAAQVMNGMAWDLFLSADTASIQAVVERGMASPADVFKYGRGSLVLWTLANSSLPIEEGFSVLLRPEVQRIAIANPRHAPYGKAAEAALRSAGVYEQVQGHLVLGENVMQATQFVQSQSVQVGIIALSLAQSPELASRGKYWIIPSSYFPPLIQSGVILKKSKNRKQALRLRDYLLSSEGQSFLTKQGFLPLPRPPVP